MPTQGVLVQRDDGLIDRLFSDAEWLNQDLRFQHWLHEWLGDQNYAEFLIFVRRADGRDIQQYAQDIEELASYTLPMLYEQFESRREPLEMLYFLQPDARDQLGAAPTLTAGEAAGARLLEDSDGWLMEVEAQLIETHDMAAPLRCLDQLLVQVLQDPAHARPTLRIRQSGTLRELPRSYLLGLANGAPWWLLLIDPVDYESWFAALARGPERDLRIGTCVVDKEALMMASHVALWEAEAGSLSLVYEDSVRGAMLARLADSVTAFLRRCLAACNALPQGKTMALSTVTFNQSTARVQVTYALMALALNAREVLAQGKTPEMPECGCRRLPDGSLYVFILWAGELITQLIVPADSWQPVENPQKAVEPWQPHQRLAIAVEGLADLLQRKSELGAEPFAGQLASQRVELQIICSSIQDNFVPGVSLGAMPERVILLARNAPLPLDQLTGLGVPVDIAAALACWQADEDAPPYAAAYVSANQEGKVVYASDPEELRAFFQLVKTGGSTPPVLEAYGLPQMLDPAAGESSLTSE